MTDFQGTDLHSPASKTRCSIVSNIERQEFIEWLRGSHSRLKKEADSGCPVCAFILWSIPTHKPSEDYDWSIECFKNELANDFSMVSEKWGFQEMDFQLFQDRVKDFSSITELTILSRVGSAPKLPEYPIGRSIFEDPRSDQYFSMIEGWLKDCIGSGVHLNCSPNSKSILPKRAIDVGQKDGQVFLYTPSASQRANYTILSHCWGIQIMFTTTIYTLKDREAGIQFSSLPQTFQDAVTFTRSWESDSSGSMPFVSCRTRLQIGERKARKWQRTTKTPI
jgi:hypothetical protein